MNSVLLGSKNQKIRECTSKEKGENKEPGESKLAFNSDMQQQQKCISEWEQQPDTAAYKCLQRC